VEDIEDKLLTNVLNNDQQVLFYILPVTGCCPVLDVHRRIIITVCIILGLGDMIELPLAIKGDARNFERQAAVQRHLLVEA